MAGLPARFVPAFISATPALLRASPPCLSRRPPAGRRVTVAAAAEMKNATAAERDVTSSLSPSSSPPPPVTRAYGAGASGAALVDASGEPLLHIVFVCPAIHWNTGNIARTCLGLGVRLHLVGPLGFSLDDRHIRRAGLDYWQHVDVASYESWDAFTAHGGAMDAIGGRRYFFTKFGAEPAVDVDYAGELDEKVVLVFGSEVDGFDQIQNWMEGVGKHERRVAFPMVDERMRAFNLSTSASFAVWDAYKAITRARRA